MTKKLLFLFFLLLPILPAIAWGQTKGEDYWVYIKQTDEITSKSAIAGTSQKGDIVEAVPCSRLGKFEPSELEKSHWLIVKMSNVTEADKNAWLTPYTETKIVDDREVTTTLAYRKNKIDVASFKTTASISSTTSFITTAVAKTAIVPIEKTATDIANMEKMAMEYDRLMPARQLVKWGWDKILPNAWAANTTNTVITTGGGDYTTLNAAEDAIDGDGKYSAGETATINCSGTSADTTAVTFAGWDADVTVIVNGEGCNTGTTGSIYSTSKYRIEVTNATGINVSDSLVITIDGVQVKLGGYNGNDNAIIFGSGGTDGTFTIRNCVICAEGTRTGDYNSGIRVSRTATVATSTYIYNNIIFDFIGDGTNNFGIYYSANDADVSVYCYNNTIQGCYVAEIKSANTKIYWSNNIVQDCTVGFTLTASQETKANIVDSTQQGATGTSADSGNTDGIGAGTNLLKDTGQNFLTTVKAGYCVVNTTATPDTYSYVVSVDSDTQLTLADDILDDGQNYAIYATYYGTVAFTDKANNNFHLASTDTIAIDKGEDKSGTFTSDIDGAGTRTGTWDIGADEYVAAGGTTPRRRMILISKNDLHKMDSTGSRRLGYCYTVRRKKLI